MSRSLLWVFKLAYNHKPMSHHRRSIHVHHYLLRNINIVVRFLIVSDVLLVGAAGLLAPIFALFIEGFIVGGNAAVAGTAAAIFLFTRSIFQIPIATFIDKVRGEKDDYSLMLIFSYLMAIVPILYLFISQPWQLYGVQFLLGLFTAFTFPSYMAIFTRHIDKNKEGTEWGVYFTLTDLSSAALAAIGGYLAETAGFGMVIGLVVAFSIIGASLLIPIKPYIKLSKK